MLNFTRRFIADKSGAVTVDWVALTAAVVVIGIGIVYAVFGSGDTGVSGLVSGLTSDLNSHASNVTGAAAVPNSLPVPTNSGN